jgi:CMP-N-acetylneuraminic acid synthetase
MDAWALVPARGGSKSVPLKNLLPLGGRPLIDYVVRSAQASGVFSRIVCSTDHERIAARANELDAAVDIRPPELATDEAKVDEVAVDLLVRERAKGNTLPDVVVLLQPTSLFLLPQHIRDLIGLLRDRPAAQSVHNVYPVPHNLHSWNQRLVADDGAVKFPFEAERAHARNKQQKPKHYAFGNLIVSRTEALLTGKGFYAKPSYALTILAPYAFDLDQQTDISMAEAMITAGVVELDHLKRPTQSKKRKRSI